MLLRRTTWITLFNKVLPRSELFLPFRLANVRVFLLSSLVYLQLAVRAHAVFCKPLPFSGAIFFSFEIGDDRHLVFGDSPRGLLPRPQHTAFIAGSFCEHDYVNLVDPPRVFASLGDTLLDFSSGKPPQVSNSFFPPLASHRSLLLFGWFFFRSQTLPRLFFDSRSP